jgi:hypothetical protein
VHTFVRHGDDMPEITGWQWERAAASLGVRIGRRNLDLVPWRVIRAAGFRH